MFTQHRKNWVRCLIAIATCLCVITALVGLEEGYGRGSYERRQIYMSFLQILPAVMIDYFGKIRLNLCACFSAL